MKYYKAVILSALFISTQFVATGQKIPDGYKLVCEESFDDAKVLEKFSFTQPNKWLLTEGKKGKAIEFTGISDYQPPFRSPHTIGLLNAIQVGSFVLEADLLQTGKEYGHRDMCIVFGFQDPAKFYYTHIATKMDDNAHQIMIVNDSARTKISTFTTQGVDWGQDQWHKVRIERDIDSGSIRVFYDGNLIEEATDKTFREGYIGFGSFDDSGKIDNVKIWSDRVVKKKTEFFMVR